jgi:hypothetical protein
MRWTPGVLATAVVLSSFPGCALLVSFEGLDDGAAAGEDASDLEAAPEAAVDSAYGTDADGGQEASLVYLGCFQDSLTRDLPHEAYPSSAMNTTVGCVQACASLGYRYAGTQAGRQCFCGDAYGGQGPAGACIVPCTGDASQICGGGFQNSVYVATGPVPSATYLGCWSDGALVADVTTRAVPALWYANSYNTIEACAAVCAYHGYVYAAVENGEQCYCGHSYGSQGPATGCAIRCPGNLSETCGDFGKEDVYQTWVPLDAGSD